MGSVTKFKRSAVVNQLRHCARTIVHNSNEDIKPELSSENVCLTPDRGGLTEYEYYKQRLDELYVYGRDDVVTMAGWVFTAPSELETKEEAMDFFRATADFLNARYGVENTVSITCHFDEGVEVPEQDRWGNPVLDSAGEVVMRKVGRPHMHFDFIPAVSDTNPKHEQEEKVNCHDVLTRRELLTIHRDLQNYLRSHNVKGAEGVLTGRTKAQGGNRTVAELKRDDVVLTHQRTIERGGREQ